MSRNKPENSQNPSTRKQSSAGSDDPADGQNSTDKQENAGETAIEKPAPGAPQDQPTPEEFGERGMGVAAKE